VVRLEDGPHLLGVEPLSAGGEADEVTEETRDDLPLLPRPRGLLEWSRALRAEARIVGVLTPAARTDPHGRRIGGGTVFRLLA
jgi:hypothetical protein